MTERTGEWAVYRCINKRCREYGTEFSGMLPAAFRRLTGHSVSCCTCDQWVELVRIDFAEPAYTPEDDDRSDEPMEFSESEAGGRGRERWARAYDALDGAPEGDHDR